MEETIAEIEFTSLEPEIGYQCPKCRRYFGDNDFSKPLKKGNKISCPHCSEGLKIEDSDKKTVSFFANITNMKLKK